MDTRLSTVSCACDITKIITNILTVYFCYHSAELFMDIRYYMFMSYIVCVIACTGWKLMHNQHSAHKLEDDTESALLSCSFSKQEDTCRGFVC